MESRRTPALAQDGRSPCERQNAVSGGSAGGPLRAQREEDREVRVLIVAPGSRGDVAPFTGLGSALRNAGHDVTIAGYAMFGGLVTASGLGFRPLPGDPRLLNAARWRQRSKGPVGGAR